MMTTIGDRLVELRARSGLTLDEIADAADYRGRSSVQKFFSSNYAPDALDMVVAGRLARAMVGRGKPPIEEEEIFALTAPGRSTLERYNYLEVNNLKRDVPVYTCLFAERMRILKNQGELSLYVIERDTPRRYDWHPPQLASISGIYGLEVYKLPLFPRFRPGETIYLNPSRVPRFGDDVCLYLLEMDDLGIDPTEREGLGASSFAVFGIYENQVGDNFTIRTFGGERTFNVHLSALREMHALINLTHALSSEPG